MGGFGWRISPQGLRDSTVTVAHWRPGTSFFQSTQAEVGRDRARSNSKGVTGTWLEASGGKRITHGAWMSRTGS